MRIGLFIGTLYGGGAERAVTRLSKLLSNKHEVYLILCEDTYMQYEYSGTLINLNIKDSTGNKINKIINVGKRIVALRKVKKDYRLDVVMSFLDSPNIVNSLAKASGCRTWLSIRNFEFGMEHSRIYEHFMGIIYRLGDLVVPVSKVITQKVISKYKLPENKVCVLYNPYDLEEIDKASKESIENAQLIEFMKGRFVFVSVGRLNHQKGFWHLLRSFAIVRKKCTNARLVIVGKGELEEKLEQLTNALGLSNSVFYTGFESNPHKIMHRADAYVLSSLFEGFPNSLTEAMVCGLPIISVDCESGPQEILFDNPNLDNPIQEVTIADYGILTPALSQGEIWDTSPAEESEILLACAMEMIYSNNELKEHLSVKAKLRAKEYGYDRALESIESFYEKRGIVS